MMTGKREQGFILYGKNVKLWTVSVSGCARQSVYTTEWVCALIHWRWLKTEMFHIAFLDKWDKWYSIRVYKSSTWRITTDICGLTINLYNFEQRYHSKHFMWF